MRVKLVGLSILLVVLAAAGMDRLAGWMFDMPEMGKTFYLNRSIRQKDYKPGMKRMVAQHDVPMSVRFRLAADAQGYIEPSALYDVPDRTIVFLGGSTTECRYVDEQSRFPYLVGRLVENQTGLKTNSYNAGVSGNNSTHSINILFNKVLRLHPDFVVMMHNANDLIVLAYTGTYWNDNRSRSATVNERIMVDRPPTLLSVVKDVLFLILPHLAYGLEKHLFAEDINMDEWSEIRGKRLTMDPPGMIRMFRNNLETFVAVTRANDSQPVLMTQFNRYGDVEIRQQLQTKIAELGLDANEFVTVYNQFNKVIREVAAENQVLLIDLDKQITKDETMMYDAIHLTKTGSETVAAIVARSLVHFIN